jgi:16S rRNA (cytosine1402-N4)-methyltransferase
VSERAEHKPVLVTTLAEQIQIPPDGVMVDATIGQGGHSYLFGQLLSTEGLIIGFDVDKWPKMQENTGLRELFAD